MKYVDENDARWNGYIHINRTNNDMVMKNDSM